MKKLFGVLILTLALAGLSFGAAGTAGPVPGANYQLFSGAFAQPYVSWAATGLTLTYSGGYMVPVAGTPRTAVVAGTLTLVGATEYIYWPGSGSALLNTVTLATAQAGSWLYTCATSSGNITGCISVSQILPTTLYAVGSTTGSGLNVLQTAPTLITPALGAATYTTLAGGAVTATGLLGLTSAPTPNAAGGISVGSNALPFSSVYIGAAGTNNIQLTGTATGARVATFPNATISVSGAVGQFCGTTTTCAATDISSTLKVVVGNAPLVSASPSTAAVTGISPAFTSAASYSCVCSDSTTAANNAVVLAAGYVSGSAFTITGPNTVTDVIRYVCVGY